MQTNLYNKIIPWILFYIVVDLNQLESLFSGKKKFDHSKLSELKCIGQGGFAVVYSAKYEGEKYALKSLNNNLNFDEKSLKWIKREAIIYISLSRIVISNPKLTYNSM